MSEPVSISYKCKFCGNQQNKSLRSGPPNPGVCLKAPEALPASQHNRYDRQ